ncbi:MAG: SLBB domain-containing protein [Burkholderiales bacterium]|nr:SLBB domain-containing protein [Burkholderiales bacterium]
MRQLRICLPRMLVALVAWLALGAAYAADEMPHPGRLAPATIVPSEVEGGAVATVGPGDTLYLTVYGQPELAAQVTLDVRGHIVVPFLGDMAVGGEAPSAIAKRIADGLRQRGYLNDPQVAIEVLRVRSRMASILGSVAKPGRYPIEGSLTLLELLAQAGGLKDNADDVAVVLRKDVQAQGGQRRMELLIGNKSLPERPVEDLSLQAGDVVYVPQAKVFYIYGEVTRGGAYPMERGLNVMRALSLAGGLTQRASERRISISRPDPDTGEQRKQRVNLDDPVAAGDVIYVDERFF